MGRERKRQVIIEVIIEEVYWGKGDFYGRNCNCATTFVAELQSYTLATNCQWVGLTHKMHYFSRSANYFSIISSSNYYICKQRNSRTEK